MTTIDDDDDDDDDDGKESRSKKKINNNVYSLFMLLSLDSSLSSCRWFLSSRVYESSVSGEYEFQQKKSPRRQ